MKNLSKVLIATALFGGLSLGLAPAARADLIVNGGFETTTGSSSGGQLGYNVNATGWSTTGYNFLFTPGSADTTGVTGSDGNLQLWGPGNGSANGLPATSPAGGNYVAADGAYEVGAINQTLSGLTVGAQYTVSFYYAGAQQEGVNFTAPTTEAWQVSFGSSTQTTPVLNNAGKGFTGWQSETFTFTADNTSDVLSFLAEGTPSGVPPFSLLDGVDVEPAVVPTPEPSSLIGGGLVVLALAGSSLRKFRQQKQA